VAFSHFSAALGATRESITRLDDINRCCAWTRSTALSHLSVPSQLRVQRSLLFTSTLHDTPSMATYPNGASSTCVVEQPIELQDFSSHPQKPQDAKVATSHTGLRLSDRASHDDDDPVENLPSPTTHAAEKLERWNSPRTNLYRSGAAFWSFVVMGSNDAAYGALIPYVSSGHWPRDID
jgi:hypothetical protein